MPNDTYKFFRLDRSQKTHPIDPNNPDKFKKNGGGVLIAIKIDLDCETKTVKLKCSVKLKRVI